MREIQVIAMSALIATGLVGCSEKQNPITAAELKGAIKNTCEFVADDDTVWDLLGLVVPQASNIGKLAKKVCAVVNKKRSPQALTARPPVVYGVKIRGHFER